MRTGSAAAAAGTFPEVCPVELRRRCCQTPTGWDQWNRLSCWTTCCQTWNDCLQTDCNCSESGNGNIYIYNVFSLSKGLRICHFTFFSLHFFSSVCCYEDMYYASIACMDPKNRRIEKITVTFHIDTVCHHDVSGLPIFSLSREYLHPFQDLGGGVFLPPVH